MMWTTGYPLNASMYTKPDIDATLLLASYTMSPLIGPLPSLLSQDMTATIVSKHSPACDHLGAQPLIVHLALLLPMCSLCVTFQLICGTSGVLHMLC